MNQDHPQQASEPTRNGFKARAIARFDRWLARPAVARRLARGGRIGGAIAALLLAYIGFLIVVTPSIGDLRQARVAQPTRLLAADGRLLDSFAQQQRERVTLEQISPHVIKALIATEDRRFYQHRGIDLPAQRGRHPAHLRRRRPGRLDHHPAAGAQPVPGRDRPLAQPQPQGQGNRSPPSRSSAPTASARSWKPTSTRCRSCTTCSASRWRRAPISTSRRSS